MARKPQFKRLITEDFADDQRTLVEKLAYPINLALEEMSSALNNNLTFTENISSQIKILTVTVDASGIPTPAISFKTTLSTKAQGMFVIRALNTTNSNTYPTGAPFISFVESSGSFSIKHITGLQASNKYQLTIIVV